MVENNDLRESLKAMQAELVDLLNQQNDGYSTDLEVTETKMCTNSQDKLKLLGQSLVKVF